MPGIVVDIGTGDGKFTYELAKEYPDRLVIGIDPSHSSLVKTSAKTYKKPVKGGLENALFVLAEVEDLPDELNGLANQVFINFPWGSLLKGLALGEEATWQSIKRICRQGAFIDILWGYDSRFESKVIENSDLPDLNIAYIKNKLAPTLADYGLNLVEAKEISTDALQDYPSSWAKKLRFRKGREYFYMRIKAS